MQRHWALHVRSLRQFTKASQAEVRELRRHWGAPTIGGAQMSNLLPDSIRKRIERACDEAEHPKGMTTGDGRARVQSSDVRRLLKLVDFIEDHNKGCLAACGKTTTFQYVRESRRCDERRDCPECPKHWIIDPGVSGT